MRDQIVLTLDIDWAPDFVIDYVASKLIIKKVKTTWFVTHQSDAVDRLKKQTKIFELGIHPNFMSGSTHGSTPEDVLHHVLCLVPDAVSMRTHGLVQSTSLLDMVMKESGIKTDVSHFLPLVSDLKPFEYYWHKTRLCRVPFFYEDDFEMEKDSPRWNLNYYLRLGQGLKVFNFHPIHVYLNSANMNNYDALKKSAGSLKDVSKENIESFVNEGKGAAVLFDEIVDYLAKSGNSLTIAELSNNFTESNGEGQ